MAENRKMRTCICVMETPKITENCPETQYSCENSKSKQTHSTQVYNDDGNNINMDGFEANNVQEDMSGEKEGKDCA